MVIFTPLLPPLAFQNMKPGVNRSILRLAIPNIISNITIPLLGIVDIALMGHLGSDDYIGAIALGALIFNFIYWGFGFLRMGTSGFTAQAWGRRDLPETFHILTKATLIGIAGGIFLLLIQKPISTIGFGLIKGEPQVESLALEYFRIRIWAAPATLGQYAILGWFIGMQNARFPMIVAIASNIFNVIFSYTLVVYAHMGTAGVALGTVIAQYLGLLLSVLLFMLYYSRLTKYLNLARAFRLKDLKIFMNVNKDIFIRTMCLVIVFSYFTARSASIDAGGEGRETILAVNSLLMEFFMFFSFLIDGLAYAGEALSGRYIGAASKQNLGKMVRTIFIWGGVTGLVFALIYLFAGSNILMLLTNNKEVINNAKPYIFWMVAIPLISFPAFLWDGIYIGATAGSAMRNSMLISTLIIFFPAYFLIRPVIGNHALWLAFILFLLSRGVTLSLMAKKHVFERVATE